MAHRKQKHKDYTIAQWPEDLSTNFDALSNPYPCHTCGKPCGSVQTLRTHKCADYRKRFKSAA